MDIRKISLYLSGKLPPDYERYNRLEFMEHLTGIFWFEFDRLDFYWKQAKEYEEEFYFLVLDYLHSKGEKDENDKLKFDRFIKKLNVQKILTEEMKTEKEIWKWDYTWDDFKQKIIEKYGAKNYDKWELFEELCEDILKASWFINTQISSRWTDGWVDIIWDKEIFIGTWAKKLLRFVWQCKYKSEWSVSLSEAEELTNLLTRVNVDTYQGALFFTNVKYQSKALSTLNETKKSKLAIETFVLNGDEIRDIINSNKVIYDKYLPRERT